MHMAVYSSIEVAVAAEVRVPEIAFEGDDYCSLVTRSCNYTVYVGCITAGQDRKSVV